MEDLAGEDPCIGEGGGVVWGDGYLGLTSQAGVFRGGGALTPGGDIWWMS